MDFNKIEGLVTSAKLGDDEAKELLSEEFTPYISNLSKRSFINSYESDDIKNECYRILFKCVRQYNPDRQRFVAYATNAIKNSINHLIRTSVRRGSSEGLRALILDGKPDILPSMNIDTMDDLIISNLNKSCLRAAIKKLPSSEQELIDYVYFKSHTLASYSEFKRIPYPTAYGRKVTILNKLKKLLSSSNYTNTLN